MGEIFHIESLAVLFEACYENVDTSCICIGAAMCLSLYLLLFLLLAIAD